MRTLLTVLACAASRICRWESGVSARRFGLAGRLGWRFGGGLDDPQRQDRCLAQFESDLVRACGSPMLSRMRCLLHRMLESLRACSSEEPRKAASRMDALASVEDDGCLEVALQVAESSKQRGDFAGGIFVDAMEANQKGEDQHARAADGLEQPLSVVGQGAQWEPRRDRQD